MNNNMKKNVTSNILISIISLVIVALIGLSSYAWFSSSDERNNVLILSDLDLNVKADLSFKNVALEPNKEYEKETTITLNEKSTNAFVKVKFECNAFVGNSNEKIVTPVLFVDENKQNSGEQTWIQAGDWFYYVGIINDNITIKFNTGLKVSNNLTNADAGKEVKLKLTVSAIQNSYGAYKEHEDWLDAPESWKTAIKKYENVLNK